MKRRYLRNQLYVHESEQIILKSKKLFLAGAGLGSTIAECALRLGFENICIIDNDSVEDSNLNRQNYTQGDIDKKKVESLATRLFAINPDARISYKPEYLDIGNIESNILEFKPDIAISAIDFNSRSPFIFDSICKENNIPIIHPYNLGWAGLLFVINKESLGLDFIQPHHQNFEISLVKYILTRLEDNKTLYDCLSSVLERIEGNKHLEYYPQLSVASWMTAGVCTRVLYEIATAKPVKLFPDFYLASTIF
ncbi:MAG: hypothetical protein H6Q14_1567 [Bacteroidetes bacterium]|jgi:molybdopterin-synthase adenylyltransferase|nr:hypothetical protein [Bacteroidota bacterium]